MNIRPQSGCFISNNILISKGILCPRQTLLHVKVISAYVGIIPAIGINWAIILCYEKRRLSTILTVPNFL